MIDFFVTLDWIAVGQIILIDILLGGDNAVVIALACKGLPEHLRKKGIFYGTFGAIGLRILMLIFALWLLQLPGLKLAGGILLIWIGAKMMLNEEDDADIKAQTTLMGAVMTISVANMIMSIDNVLAITAAAQNSHEEHQLALVIFGTLLSIPIIIWCSSLVLKLLDRFPIFIVFGAGLLGWIAGDMIAQDSIVINNVFASINVTTTIEYGIKILGAIIVITFGYLWRNYNKKKQN